MIYKLYDVANALYINCKLKYVRSLFGISYVEAVGRTEDFDMGKVFELHKITDAGTEVVFKGIVRDMREKDRGIVEAKVYSLFVRMSSDYRAVKYSEKYNWEIAEAMIDLYNGIYEQPFGGVKYDYVDKLNEQVYVEYLAVDSRILGEVIKLFWMSGWYFTDEYDSTDGKWYAVPRKVNDTGLSLKEGNNATLGIVIGVKDKKVDSGVLINKLIVKGREVVKRVVETGTVGTGGVITTQHKISGEVKVDIGGTVISDFKVYPESKQIIVDSSYADSTYTVEYGWRQTKTVILRDGDSIKKYGERVKVEKVNLDDYDSLMAYGNRILEIYSKPSIKLDIDVKGTEFELGDKVSIGLYNTLSKTYEYSDYVVVRKVWENGRLWYSLGNASHIFTLLRDVLESMKLNLSSLEIANIEKLDNPLIVRHSVSGSSVFNTGYSSSTLTQFKGVGYSLGNVGYACSDLAYTGEAVLLFRGFDSVSLDSANEQYVYDYSSGYKGKVYLKRDKSLTGSYWEMGVTTVANGVLGQMDLDYVIGDSGDLEVAGTTPLKIVYDVGVYGDKLSYVYGLVLGVNVDTSNCDATVTSTLFSFNLTDGTNSVSIPVNMVPVIGGNMIDLADVGHIKNTFDATTETKHFLKFIVFMKMDTVNGYAYLKVASLTYDGTYITKEVSMTYSVGSDLTISIVNGCALFTGTMEFDYGGNGDDDTDVSNVNALQSDSSVIYVGGV